MKDRMVKLFDSQKVNTGRQAEVDLSRGFAVFILFSLSFWFFADTILPKFLKTYLNFLGRNITAYYVISWVLVSVLIHVCSVHAVAFSGPTALVVEAGSIVLCSLCTMGYKHVRKKMRAAK